MSWWKRRRDSDEDRDRARGEGWDASLDAIEEFLGQHQWVTEEDDRVEIFCDGCGASLSKKLKSMRKHRPSGD
jgi:hypothetical protein